MQIEGIISPTKAKILIEALKEDPLSTEDQLLAGKQNMVPLMCAKNQPISVSTIHLSSIEHPDVSIIAGFLAIGEDTHVIFEQTDTTDPKTVAVSTLASFCKRVDCANKGCAALKEKQAGLDARKQPNRKRKSS